MSPRAKRRWKWAGIVALVLVASIQFVPVDRRNPPVTGEIQVPDDVKAVLRRACWDCHSNETHWPWYSYVAPISWRVAGHVHDGRKELNFSEWASFPPGRQHKKRQQVWDEVREGKMPLSDYLWLHPGAALTDADRAVLAAWSAAGG